MWFFGKKRKTKEIEQKRQDELAKQAKIEEEKFTKVTEKKQEVKKATLVKENPPAKKTNKKSLQNSLENEKKSPSGKYEIYQEAGMFKFRLKASNGEVLAVSLGYSTGKGAKSGIETFKRAVENGNFEISTDKSRFSHFDLFGSRKARVIIIGEFYSTLKKAESAVESVKKFYQTSKIVKLDTIPVSEIREKIIPKQKVEENKNGKYQLIKKNSKTYFIKLVASNGQILLVSQKYASKQSAMNGLESIKNAITNQNFTICKDKQNRYQYKLYTNNKQLIISGETYPVKQSCLSSIQSVLRFAGKAKFVEL